MGPMGQHTTKECPSHLLRKQWMQLLLSVWVRLTYVLSVRKFGNAKSCPF